LWAFLCALILAASITDESPPWFFLPSILLVLILDCLGGVRFRESELQFRNVRRHVVRYQDILKVTVETGAGAKGAQPLVYLHVTGRTRPLRVTPTASFTRSDCEQYARELRSLLDKKTRS